MSLVIELLLCFVAVKNLESERGEGLPSERAPLGRRIVKLNVDQLARRQLDNGLGKRVRDEPHPPRNGGSTHTLPALFWCMPWRG